MGTHEVTETPRHSVSVAAAIFDESGENVLLIKRRDNGHWEPPGGVLELDETVEDGLRREVLEETGAQIEVGNLTGVYKNMSHGIVALVLRCTLVGEHDNRTAEAEVVQWHDTAAIEDIMSPAYAIRVLDALQGATPRIRAHDGTHLLPSRNPVGEP